MSALTQWNPFRSLAGREDAFDDFVREFFGKTDGGDFLPPVEVAESEGAT